MKITSEKIKHLAKLARLKLNDSETEKMVLDLQLILEFVEKLDKVNTKKQSPLTHIHEKHNIYRDDIRVDVNMKSKMLENAPNHNSDYIKAPKVL